MLYCLITQAAHQLKSLFQQCATELSDLIRKHNTQALEANTSRPPHVLLTIRKTTIELINHELFSPIIPILTSHPRDLARFLYSKGLLVRPIGTPTVPPGSEQVRVCLHACNTSSQIDCLVKQIDLWMSSQINRPHL